METTGTETKLFLLVWHDKNSTVIVGSHNKDVADLVIPPGFKVPVDEYWLGVPHFVRDVSDGLLHTERSAVIPRNVELTIPAEYDASLDPNQKEFAKLLCTTDFPYSPQIMENIQLHKLLGPGGVPRQNVKVTKRYLMESHRPCLMATVEMEKSRRNRTEVIKLLNEAITAIDAL